MNSENKYPRLEIMVACDQNFGIGLDEKLPWKIPSEYAYFKRMTKNRENNEGKVHATIFARGTWEIIKNLYGENNPWKDTIIFVLSRSMPAGKEKDLYVCSTFDDIIDHLNRPEIKERVDRVWVHGGRIAYAAALGSPYFFRLYQTRIRATYPCNVFFPRFNDDLLKLVHDPDVPQGVQQDAGVDYLVHVFETTGVNPLLQ